MLGAVSYIDRLSLVLEAIVTPEPQRATSLLAWLDPGPDGATAATVGRRVARRARRRPISTRWSTGSPSSWHRRGLRSGRRNVPAPHRSRPGGPMPVPLDEYPIHQAPLSIAYMDTSDRNAYDRCYLNAHDRTGDVFLVTGLGLYPNLGVIDAYATVRDAATGSTRSAPRTRSATTACVRRSARTASR